MNNLTTFDINKFTPYAVGFDRVFDRLWDHAIICTLQQVSLHIIL